MNWTVAQRILGLLLMMFSITMLLPMLVGILYRESSWLLFAESFAIILGTGALAWEAHLGGFIAGFLVAPLLAPGAAGPSPI